MSNGVRGRVHKIIQVLFDSAIIHIGFLTAFWIMDGFSYPPQYINSIPWMSAVFFLIFYFFNGYTGRQRKSIQPFMYSIILSLGMFATLMMGVTIFISSTLFTLTDVILAFVIQGILFMISHFLIWRISKAIYGGKKLLILAESEKMGLYLADKIQSHNKGWFTISGLLLASQKQKLQKYINEIDVLLISPSIDEKQLKEIVSFGVECGKEVLFVPNLFEIFVQDSTIQQVDDMLVFSIPSAKLSVPQRIAKRAFDLIVATTILIVTSPITILLWILIPLTSQGSAFFQQVRIGKAGKPYQIYKFRSMVQNAEKNTGPILATEHDPRITKIGKIIRSTRLDELPQLYNVFKGEMSLIGPRPEREFFIKEFQQQLPSYAYRMSVKPGLTGLAQTKANYTTTVEEKLRFDLMYIRHYSFTLDMKILMQTIQVVLQREQADGVKERKTTVKMTRKLILGGAIDE